MKQHRLPLFHSLWKNLVFAGTTLILIGGMAQALPKAGKGPLDDTDTPTPRPGTAPVIHLPTQPVVDNTIRTKKIHLKVELVDVTSQIQQELIDWDEVFAMYVVRPMIDLAGDRASASPKAGLVDPVWLSKGKTLPFKDHSVLFEADVDNAGGVKAAINIMEEDESHNWGDEAKYAKRLTDSMNSYVGQVVKSRNERELLNLALSEWRAITNYAPIGWEDIDDVIASRDLSIPAIGNPVENIDWYAQGDGASYTVRYRITRTAIPDTPAPTPPPVATTPPVETPPAPPATTPPSIPTPAPVVTPPTPSLPDVPVKVDPIETPKIPTLPRLPNIPTIPVPTPAPTLPDVPVKLDPIETPKLPTIPSLPNIPTLPTLPTIPVPPVQTLPDVPVKIDPIEVPKIPTVPSLPTIPPIFEIPPVLKPPVTPPANGNTGVVPPAPPVSVPPVQTPPQGHWGTLPPDVSIPVPPVHSVPVVPDAPISTGKAPSAFGDFQALTSTWDVKLESVKIDRTGSKVEALFTFRNAAPSKQFLSSSGFNLAVIDADGVGRADDGDKYRATVDEHFPTTPTLAPGASIQARYLFPLPAGTKTLRKLTMQYWRKDRLEYDISSLTWAKASTATMPTDLKEGKTEFQALGEKWDVRFDGWRKSRDGGIDAFVTFHNVTQEDGDLTYQTCLVAAQDAAGIVKDYESSLYRIGGAILIPTANVVIVPPDGEAKVRYHIAPLQGFTPSKLTFTEGRYKKDAIDISIAP